jgi:energy-converting hydrogenase Eha subunit A
MSKIIIELSETSEIIIAEIIALLIILIIVQMIHKINNIWKDKPRRRPFDD